MWVIILCCKCLRAIGTIIAHEMAAILCAIGGASATPHHPPPPQNTLFLIFVAINFFFVNICCYKFHCLCISSFYFFIFRK